MNGIIKYVISAAALAASACAPAQRVEVYTGGRHTSTTLGEVDEDCLAGRVEAACAEDPMLIYCIHPQMNKACYEQNITICDEDMIVVSTDNDRDGEFGPDEEDVTTRDYNCARFVIPASTR